MAVKAEIIDANTHRFAAGERFLIDTNIWFWICYASAPDAPGAKVQWQSRAYPTLLRTMLQAGGLLHWSPFSWSELGHIVERTEWEIAVKCGATEAKNVKQYRYANAGERSRVTELIQSTWAQVTAIATPMPAMTLDEAAVQRANAELPSVMLDGYDLFLAQQLRDSGITGILSDDGDFASVPGIRLFTLNRRILSGSASQPTARP